MQLQEIIRRAEKELSTATRNLETAKRRSAPEQDVRNLEAKAEYRKAVLDILNSGHLELFGKVEQLKKENADLLARAEQAERERDAAISDLERAEKIAEETYTLLNNKIQPVLDYSVYTAIHDSVTDIVDWEKDSIWRKKEE